MRIPKVLYTYLTAEILAPFLASFIILNGVLILARMTPFLDTLFDFGIGFADFTRLCAYLAPQLFLFNQTWLDFHDRISYICLGIPLLLLGLPMLILINERWGRDTSLAIPASCGLAFGAWIWWGAFQSMAKVSFLHPIPASWTVHFLVGRAWDFLLRRQNR